jgi:hypothetical protein
MMADCRGSRSCAALLASVPLDGGEEGFSYATAASQYVDTVRSLMKKCFCDRY